MICSFEALRRNAVSWTSREDEEGTHEATINKHLSLSGHHSTP
jgi:hypothetical protein